MGKQRIIAETGAGQHGVATATVCARFGLECVIYMGAEDMRRQALNVFRMRLLGATVQPVTAGTATLKDATSEAIRDWVTNVESTHYILGSVAGPHPYPMLVRDFHAVIGEEAKRQCHEAFGRLPDVLIACVGGGSNAMGLFHPFVEDTSRADDRCGGRRRRGGHRPPCRHHHRGPGGGAARRHEPAAAGRRGPGAGGPFDQRRSRLPGGGPGAQLPAPDRPGRVWPPSPTRRP
jgi:hypothetical protein